MVVLKCNRYSYAGCFAATSVFSVQFVVTNYSVSATKYFATFWQLMTLSVPCTEHHSVTPAAYEHMESSLAGNSQISKVGY